MKICDLTIEITNRCNLFCKQCDIWKERPFFDLTINDIDKVLNISETTIKNISLTGGEIFAHPNFEEIFKYMLKLRIKKHIRGLNLVSNGYDYEVIVQFLEKYKNYEEHFDLDFSIDGKEEEHNYQRGSKTAFKNTIKTMLHARTLFPKMKISLKFTINNRNYNDLPEIYEFCKKYLFHLYPKLIEAGTENYYHRLGGQSVIQLASVEDKSEEIISVLKKLQDNEIIEEYIIPLLIQKLQGRFILKSCSTPETSLFLSARGDIFSCLYYNKLCNINEPDWEKGLTSDYQKKIIKEGSCGSCPGCFAYHGFLKKQNIEKHKVN